MQAVDAPLRPQRTFSMLIATAGHIDHGKSALVRALTGVETDRLPEEKARGISIDLGFAYWRPDNGPTIGFVDVPGHERFLRNMMAGLSGIDFALLVVAADDGIMPQTVEHLRILELLGFSRGLVALTKIDRVSPDRIAELQRDVKSLLAPTRLSAAQLFPVSSLTGDGVQALASAILAARAQPADDPDHHFRLAIDRVFSVVGSGTVVTGTVLAGSARVDDNLMVAPIGRAVRLRGLQSSGIPVERVVPGQRCALNLSGVEVNDVHRGDWLVPAASHAPTTRIEALVEVLADRPAPISHGSTVHLHIDAADITARLLVPGQRALAPGSQTHIQIALDRPAMALCGSRFVLRDAAGRDLIGGGRVLDPLASDRRRPAAERTARAEAMSRANPAEKLAMLANIPGVEPALTWFAQACNLTAQAATRIAREGDFVLAGQDRDLVIGAARFGRLCDALVSAIDHCHRENPLQGGIPRKQARSRMGEAVSSELFGHVLREASSTGRVEADGALLRLPGHKAAFSAAENTFWRQVVDPLEDLPPRAIAVAELAKQLHSSPAAITAMLLRRKLAGDVWQVTDTRYMLRSHVAQLATLAAALEAKGGSGFSAAEFRDASGIGRNFVIDLLEFFDRIGLTRREANLRRMRADWELVTGPVQN